MISPIKTLYIINLRSLLHLSIFKQDLVINNKFNKLANE